MPDPMGGKRLLDYDCKVSYEKSHLIVARKIEEPDDIRPGTKKGKLDRKPTWIIKIQMPKKLIADIYTGYIEDAYIDPTNSPTPTPDAQPAEDAAAAAEPEEGVAETAEGDVDMVTGDDPDLT